MKGKEKTFELELQTLCLLLANATVKIICYFLNSLQDNLGTHKNRWFKHIWTNLPFKIKFWKQFPYYKASFDIA